MMIHLLLQIDIPIPTPIPTNAAMSNFEIPSNIPHDAIVNSVQIWNTLNAEGHMEIVQAGFLLMIIFAGLGMVVWAVRRRN